MTLRAAVIGCGGVSPDHCTGINFAEGIELVALVDLDAARLNAAADRFSVSSTYSDHLEMLHRAKPDLVVVCTQAPAHKQVVVDSARSGVKGILCEKPIAVSLSDADEMIDVCRASGCRLAINHQTRMIPEVYLAERLLREGAIGDLRTARMIDKGYRPAGVSLMELVTHLFDLLLLFAGPPQWVSGHLTVAEGDGQRLAGIADIRQSQDWPRERDCGLVLGERCSAAFGFAGMTGLHTGMTATLESFFQTHTPLGRWHPSLELIGTEGALFLGGTSDHVDLFLHRGPWNPPGNLERVSAPPPPAGPAPFHTLMMEELAECIQQGREHRSSGQDGRAALEMILGIYDSHRKGGARTCLPSSSRQHPLERWLRDEGMRDPRGGQVGGSD